MGRTLHGKVVVITGAARGIGLATARAFLQQGAVLGLSDIDEVALKHATAELEGTVVASSADVTDAASLRGFIDRVESELGPVDVMVNNAGIMPTGSVVDEPDLMARKTVEINVLGVITGTKRALETMLPRRRGVIVTLASVAGESAVPGLATYNASKWGALGFTLATRAEVGEHGVDVVAVLPAFVNTELTSGTNGLAGFKNVEPETVAEAIVDAVRRPRAKVYVPRSVGAIVQLTSLLPEGVTRLIGRALKAEKVMLDDVDTAARRAYLERISGDTPRDGS
jgi:NAD(P)-dependent dehydrogenase (short-subunit alcohol dehydrogenase family)